MLFSRSANSATSTPRNSNLSQLDGDPLFHLGNPVETPAEQPNISDLIVSQMLMPIRLRASIANTIPLPLDKVKFPRLRFVVNNHAHQV